MLKIYRKILKKLSRIQINIPIKILLFWNFSRHHINCLLFVYFSLQISLPIEPPQSRAQAARLQGPRLPGALAQLLREEPATRDLGHPWTPVQRDLAGRGRMWADVLWAWLSAGRGRRGGAMRLHLPLVLRGQVQAVSDQEGHLHVSLRTLTALKATVLYSKPPLPSIFVCVMYFVYA